MRYCEKFAGLKSHGRRHTTRQLQRQQYSSNTALCYNIIAQALLDLIIILELLVAHRLDRFLIEVNNVFQILHSPLVRFENARIKTLKSSPNHPVCAAITKNSAEDY